MLFAHARIEPDRHRTVVDQRDVHRRTKDARRDGFAERGGKRRDKPLERRRRDLRRGRGRPRGPGPVLRGVRQRELAHGQNGASDVLHRAVHRASIVVEDAQRDDLAHQPVAVVVAVVACHTRQDDDPRTYLADDASIDANRRLARTLHERPHFLYWVRSTVVTTPATKVTVVTVSGSPSAGNQVQRTCLPFFCPVVMSGVPTRASTSPSDIPLCKCRRSAGSPRRLSFRGFALFSVFASLAWRPFAAGR